jgi:hypothetical protein
MDGLGIEGRLWHIRLKDVAPLQPYGLSLGRGIQRGRELPRQSYARHYEWMLQQLRAMIGFRLFDYYLRSRTDIRELRDLRDLKGIEFLKTLGLGRQRSCSEVYAAAQASASPALSGLERA